MAELSVPPVAAGREPYMGMVALLGVATIVAYGASYYAYGALIDPIRAATGWSQTGLGAVFSLVLAIGGVGGAAGGRLADQLGTRVAFGVAAVLGGGAIAAASYASSLVGFAVAYATGCGVVGALAFYHVTQPAAIRLGADEPARAVVRLTLLGALASPIFVPLTAWLAQLLGWRGCIRLEAALTAAVLIAAAVLVDPRRTRAPARADRRSVPAALRRAWRTAGVRRWLAASLVAGAAVDVILVYQVPAMVAAGLPMAAAAAAGSVRGLAQVGGRLVLTPALARLGTVRTIVWTMVCAAVGVLCLLAAGHLIVAFAFSVLAGAAIGAISTLQGIHTNELVGGEDLALLMGGQQAVFAVGSAVGPVLAGALIGATHSYSTVVLTAVACLLAAGALMAGGGLRDRLRRLAPISNVWRTQDVRSNQHQ